MVSRQKRCIGGFVDVVWFSTSPVVEEKVDHGEKGGEGGGRGRSAPVVLAVAGVGCLYLALPRSGDTRGLWSTSLDSSSNLFLPHEHHIEMTCHPADTFHSMLVAMFPEETLLFGNHDSPSETPYLFFSLYKHCVKGAWIHRSHIFQSTSHRAL